MQQQWHGLAALVPGQAPPAPNPYLIGNLANHPPQNIHTHHATLAAQMAGLPPSIGQAMHNIHSTMTRPLACLPILHPTLPPLTYGVGAMPYHLHPMVAVQALPHVPGLSNCTPMMPGLPRGMMPTLPNLPSRSFGLPELIGQAQTHLKPMMIMPTCVVHAEYQQPQPPQATHARTFHHVAPALAARCAALSPEPASTGHAMGPSLPFHHCPAEVLMFSPALSHTSSYHTPQSHISDIPNCLRVCTSHLLPDAEPFHLAHLAMPKAQPLTLSDPQRIIASAQPSLFTYQPNSVPFALAPEWSLPEDMELPVLPSKQQGPVYTRLQESQCQPLLVDDFTLDFSIKAVSLLHVNASTTSRQELRDKAPPSSSAASPVSAGLPAPGELLPERHPAAPAHVLGDATNTLLVTSVCPERLKQFKQRATVPQGPRFADSSSQWDQDGQVKGINPPSHVSNTQQAACGVLHGSGTPTKATRADANTDVRMSADMAWTQVLTIHTSPPAQHTSPMPEFQPHAPQLLPPLQDELLHPAPECASGELDSVYKDQSTRLPAQTLPTGSQPLQPALHPMPPQDLLRPQLFMETADRQSPGSKPVAQLTQVPTSQLGPSDAPRAVPTLARPHLDTCPPAVDINSATAAHTPPGIHTVPPARIIADDGTVVAKPPHRPPSSPYWLGNAQAPYMYGAPSQRLVPSRMVDLNGQPQQQMLPSPAVQTMLVPTSKMLDTAHAKPAHAVHHTAQHAINVQQVHSHVSVRQCADEQQPAATEKSPDTLFNLCVGIKQGHYRGNPPVIDLMGQTLKGPMKDNILIINCPGLVLRNGAIILPAEGALCIAADGVQLHGLCITRSTSNGFPSITNLLIIGGAHDVLVSKCELVFSRTELLVKLEDQATEAKKKQAALPPPVLHVHGIMVMSNSSLTINQSVISRAPGNAVYAVGPNC